MKELRKNPGARVSNEKPPRERGMSVTKNIEHILMQTSLRRKLFYDIIYIYIFGRYLIIGNLGQKNDQ